MGGGETPGNHACKVSAVAPTPLTSPPCSPHLLITSQVCHTQSCGALRWQ